MKSIALFSLFCAAVAPVSAEQILRRASTLISVDAPLKPRIGKPNGPSQEFELATNPLSRLLFERQLNGCPSGFGECPNDPSSCCPTGSSCCAQSAGCCPRGQFCYSTGCCDNGEFGCAGNTCCPSGSNCCSSLGGGCCAASDNCVRVNGQDGCCAKGQTCDGSATGCSIASDIPCPGENFCCPAGSTCTRDSSGQPACGTGGGSGPTTPPPPPPTTTPRTTSTPSVTFVSTSTPPAVPSSPPASAPAFTQSFPGPQSAGATNSTVGATDPRISYGTGDWAGSTACTETSKKATLVGSTMQFQFIGSAIFMNTVVGQSAGVFNVQLDGAGVDVDGNRATQDCDVNWSAFGLQNALHTVIVTYKGASKASTASSSTSSFEFTHFIVTSTGGSGSSTGTSQGGLNPTGLVSNGSPVLGAATAWGWSALFGALSAILAFL